MLNWWCYVTGVGNCLDMFHSCSRETGDGWWLRSHESVCRNIWDSEQCLEWGWKTCLSMMIMSCWRRILSRCSKWVRKSFHPTYQNYLQSHSPPFFGFYLLKVHVMLVTKEGLTQNNPLGSTQSSFMMNRCDRMNNKDLNIKLIERKGQIWGQKLPYQLFVAVFKW